MAGGWPTGYSHANGQSLSPGVTSAGATLTSSASANTYGTYTQLIASTAYDITHLLLQLTNQSVSGYAVALRLAAAAAGSEASGLIVQNLIINHPHTSAYNIMLPVNIKAGSRLAAAVATDNASQTPKLTLLGFDCGFYGDYQPGVIDTYGWAGTAGTTITGFNVDPGATANTKGAWVQLSASVTNDLAGFFLGFDSQGKIGNGSSTDAPTQLDVGLGAAGSEKIIVPDLSIFNFPQNYTIEVSPLFTDKIMCPIKAGTRLAVRSRSSNNRAGDRTLGVSLYGIRA